MSEASSPAKCRILAICNQKGGVGKTTTAINLAASLAAAEHRVLLIDLDPQGNASSGVGHRRGGDQLGTYDFLLGSASLEDVALPTDLPTLHVMTATTDLAGAEIELVDAERRESVLRSRLTPKMLVDWSFVIIDCPPSLGLLTVNALVAANAVLIPMQARYFSLEGLGSLMETIDRIRGAFNPDLCVEGIVFCMHEQRTNLSQQVVAEVHRHFANDVFEVVIPQNVRLSESPSFGKPALLYDIESKGAQAYLELARELLTRLEERQQL